MLNVLNKSIKKIENFQENCAELCFSLGTLLGENVSIADIAVNKTPEKKRRALKEAVIKRKSGEVIQIDSAGKKRKLPRSIANEVERGAQVLSAGDEENIKEKSNKNSKENDKVSALGAEKEKPGALRGKIIKTEHELEINDSLSNWVANYFDARRQGRFAEADVMKRRIDSVIGEKRLDRETVYFRADDISREKEEKKKNKAGNDNEDDEKDNNSE